MPGFASHVLAEETSPNSCSERPIKCPRRWLKLGPQPLAEIKSLAAASSWQSGTPGRIFEIAVSLAALAVSYTSLCASLTESKKALILPLTERLYST